VFELLGYQVESEPLPVSLDDPQLSGRDQETVESFHLLSSYGDDFLIGLWQLMACQCRRTRWTNWRAWRRRSWHQKQMLLLLGECDWDDRAHQHSSLINHSLTFVELLTKIEV